MITEINESKTLKSIYHANANVNLMEENVIETNHEIMINVDVKTVVYVKKIMFEILLHVVVKILSKNYG